MRSGLVMGSPFVCVDGVDGDVSDGSEDESVLACGDGIDDPEEFVGCEEYPCPPLMSTCVDEAEDADDG